MRFKSKYFIFIFLSFLIVIGCRKMPDGNTYVNLYGCSSGQSVYICFDSLLTDSRCPQKMECLWSGNALIKVTFHEGGNIHAFTMSLLGYPAFDFPSDTLINGHHITFAELLPYPGDGNFYPYKASLIIN